MDKYSTPEELLYTESHEWVERLPEEKGYVYVGITDFAQSSLGDIVYINLEAEIGDKLEKGEVLATIEAVKTVSDIIMPITGKIVEFNEDLEDTPENINDDVYNEGWIVKVKITDEKEYDSLVNYDEYEAYIYDVD